MTSAVIVEDDPYSAQVLSQYLGFIDISSQATPSGEDVLNILGSTKDVAIIFVDLELEDGSGYDVLKTIKSKSAYNAIPVVAYTSHTTEKVQAQHAGFNSFISKPINNELFMGQVQNILNGDPVWE